MEPKLHKMVGMIFGFVFIAVGLLGFIMSPTLIVFGVNALHNVVHLASGAALLAGAYMAGGQNARTINLTVGVVYLLVAALGFLAPALTDSLVASDGDAFPFADAALHAILGIALVGSAFAVRDTRGATPSR